MSGKTSLERLMAQMPEDAVERTHTADRFIGGQKVKGTGRGYDTTGYGYQFVVNRLNEVLGIAGWSESYEIARDFEGSWAGRNGAPPRPWYEITVSCRIEFTDPDTGKASHREACGWHKAAVWGDALKGAQTNALKKTASKIGAGWQAYADAVDDDNTPVDDPEESEESRSPDARQIQEEARSNGAQPTEQKSQKRIVWERIQAAISTLGDGESARVLGCSPAAVGEWKPANEGEANTKMVALETAVARRRAHETREATA